ncbi:hypothetical protein ACFL56_00595 [Candidatus Margulisiibacteriota bacterium]
MKKIIFHKANSNINEDKSLHFMTTDGKYQKKYGIGIIYPFNSKDLEELGVYELIKKLEKYKFILPPNPHFIINLMVLNLETDPEKQAPFEEKCVNEVFNESIKIWETKPYASPFELELKKIELLNPPNRNASRLTIITQHTEIGSVRQKYLKRYSPFPGWASGEHLFTTTVNLGFSSVSEYDEISHKEIQQLLDMYNREILPKTILIKRATLIYHQNSFASENLREQDLPFRADFDGF